MLTKCGNTKTGTPVFSGLFRFHETYGVPLENVIDIIWDEHGAVPCWVSLLSEMVGAGIDKDAALSRINSAVSETYLPEDVKKEILNKLPKVHDVLFR